MGGSSKKQTVGYRYHVGLQFIVAHGVADKFVRVRVNEKPVLTTTPFVSTANNYLPNKIDLPELFGGESKEGGIVGTVSFDDGDPAQSTNSYLASVLGSNLPAFRGVIGFILEQVYIGTNPYLKKWDFRVQRVNLTSDGEEQWNITKASITFGNPTVGHVVTDSAVWIWKVFSTRPILIDEVESTINFGVGSHTNGLGYSQQGGTSEGAGSIVVDQWRLETPPEDDFPWLFNDPDNPILEWDTFAPAKSMEATTEFTLEKDQPILRIYGTTRVDSGQVFLDDVKVGDLLQAEVIRSNVFDFFVINVKKGTHTVKIIGVRDQAEVTPLGINYIGARVDIPISTYEAMNPAHIIRECLIDTNWGMSYDPSQIDAASFVAIADILHDDEKIALCLMWNKQESIKAFVDEVKRHINAELFLHRSTGLFTLKLIRNDYDINTIPVLNESNIIKIANFKRPVASELINSVTVTYYDMEMSTDSTITVQDIALVRESGAVVPVSVNYRGFPNAEMASRAAERDLRSLSSPLITCALTVHSSAEISELNIGSVFLMSWGDYGIDNIVMRVTEANFGDGKHNSITLKAAQDVFASPSIGLINESVSDWEDPAGIPLVVPAQIGFEIPYFELVQTSSTAATNNALLDNPDVGYVAAAAKRPQGGINARLYTDSGAGFAQVGLLDFCPTASLDSDVDKIEKTFSVSNVSDVSDLALGTWFQLDDELLSLETYNGSDTITVKRGVLDTVPANHSKDAILFFWDDFAEGDPTEYVASDFVSIRSATISGSGELPFESAPNSEVTLQSRAIRPYPPGNVEFNGDHFPIALEDPMVATWESRNRLQQTSGILLDWYAGSVTPEAGTTYTVTIHRDNETEDVLETISGITALTTPIAAIGESGFFLAKVSTQRDGYDSLNLVENRFWYSTLNDVTFPRAFSAQQENQGLLTLGILNPDVGVTGELQLAIILHRGAGQVLVTGGTWVLVTTTSDLGANDSKISIYKRIVAAPRSTVITNDFTSTNGDIKDAYLIDITGATSVGSVVEKTAINTATGSITTGDMSWTASTLYIYDWDVLSSNTMAVESVDDLINPIEFKLGATEGTGDLRMFAAYNHFAEKSDLVLSNVCDYTRITAIEILT